MAHVVDDHFKDILRALQALPPPTGPGSDAESLSLAEQQGKLAELVPRDMLQRLTSKDVDTLSHLVPWGWGKVLRQLHMEACPPDQLARAVIKRYLPATTNGGQLHVAKHLAAYIDPLAHFLENVLAPTQVGEGPVTVRDMCRDAQVQDLCAATAVGHIVWPTSVIVHRLPGPFLRHVALHCLQNDQHSWNEAALSHDGESSAYLNDEEDVKRYRQRMRMHTVEVFWATVLGFRAADLTAEQQQVAYYRLAQAGSRRLLTVPVRKARILSSTPTMDLIEALRVDCERLQAEDRWPVFCSWNRGPYMTTSTQLFSAREPIMYGPHLCWMYVDEVEVDVSCDKTSEATTLTVTLLKQRPDIAWPTTGGAGPETFTLPGRVPVGTPPSVRTLKWTPPAATEGPCVGLMLSVNTPGQEYPSACPTLRALRVHGRAVVML